jgi:hypothetical protein
MNADQRDHELERLIDRTLRDQPSLQAPATLQSRVWAGIEQRAALSWWRRGFAYWPLAAQVAFAILSVGFVKAGLDAAMWGMEVLRTGPLAATLDMPMDWIRTLSGVVTFIHGLWTLLVHNIPTLWIYAGVCLFAAMYATLFGLSAAAYRTLYASR